MAYKSEAYYEQYAALPENLQSRYNRLKEISKGFKSFLYSGNVKMLDEQVADEIRTYFESRNNEPTPKPPKEPKAPKAKKATKAKAKRPRTAKAPKFDRKKFTMVKKLPAELAFVKRYLRMDNKVVTKHDILNFIRSIEKQNTEGAFTVKGKYGSEVKHIHAELNKLYNDKKTGNSFTFLLDKNDETLLKNFKYLVSSTVVEYSVQIVKAYLALLGKPDTTKAENMLKKIADHEKTGKIKASDKNRKYIDTIKRVLKSYIDGGELSHTQAELKGLGTVGDVPGTEIDCLDSTE